MVKKIGIAIIGLLCGVIGMFFVLRQTPNSHTLLNSLLPRKPSIIGFLPYWLISEKNYSPYINTVSYFGVTIDEDGTILKQTKPTESEPGWYALQSGKVSPVLERAKKNNIKRSLVVFSGDQEKIDILVGNPINNGITLTKEIIPILNQNGFTDLNIDIESVSEASSSARENFTLLVKTVREQLQKNNNPITLSIDVSPTALIKPYLVDVSAIAPYVDTVIFMIYDFHYQGSSVTGAVSPVNGAGITAEFDAETSIQEALKVLSPEKIIMGVPHYGYEWETLSSHPHAAIIPGTGITASNKRVEDFLIKCATCSAQFDPVGKESYVIYKDDDTNTYHQFFYPDEKAMQEKINLMKKYELGGIALWALGYEGETILDPLKNVDK